MLSKLRRRLSFLLIERSSIQRLRAVFFFYSLSLFQSLARSSRPEDHRNVGRRERFISTPVAIVPFVSQPASHGSRRRAFSLTSSVSHPRAYRSSVDARSLARPHGRFDRWTNRPVVISTYPQVRLIRPGDVFIHRASLPLWWMTRRRAPLPTLRAYLRPISPVEPTRKSASCARFESIFQRQNEATFSF